MAVAKPLFSPPVAHSQPQPTPDASNSSIAPPQALRVPQVPPLLPAPAPDDSWAWRAFVALNWRGPTPSSDAEVGVEMRRLVREALDRNLSLHTTHP